MDRVPEPTGLSFYDAQARFDQVVSFYTEPVLRQLEHMGMGGWEVAEEVPFNDFVFDIVGRSSAQVLADLQLFVSGRYTEGVGMAIAAFIENRGLDAAMIPPIEEGES